MAELKQVGIVDFARSPIGKAKGGVLGGVTSIEIGAQVLRGVGNAQPQLKPLVMPVIAIYILFAILTWLETSLDAASAVKLNPGRTESLRRLNRTEYQNANRDLLALAGTRGLCAVLTVDEFCRAFLGD